MSGPFIHNTPSNMCGGLINCALIHTECSCLHSFTNKTLYCRPTRCLHACALTTRPQGLPRSLFYGSLIPVLLPWYHQNSPTHVEL